MSPSVPWEPTMSFVRSRCTAFRIHDVPQRVARGIFRHIRTSRLDCLAVLREQVVHAAVNFSFERLLGFLCGKFGSGERTKRRL